MIYSCLFSSFVFNKNSVSCNGSLESEVDREMSHIKIRPKPPRRPKPPEILTTTTQENINLTMCSKTECPNQDPSYCWCDRPVPTTTTNASGATMPQTEIMVNVLVSTRQIQIASEEGPFENLESNSHSLLLL